MGYFLIAGRPPADNPSDLPARLRAGDGLRLSDAKDGVGEFSQELVRASTAPIVGKRIHSVAEYLDYCGMPAASAAAWTARLSGGSRAARSDCGRETASPAAATP